MGVAESLLYQSPVVLIAEDEIYQHIQWGEKTEQCFIFVLSAVVSQIACRQYDVRERVETQNVIDGPRHAGMSVHLFLVEFARNPNVHIQNLNDQHEVAPTRSSVSLKEAEGRVNVKQASKV